MQNNRRASRISRHRRWLGVLVLLIPVAGCNPYSTAVKIGVKVVGDVANDADVKEHAKLVGEPVSAADAAFGQRLRTLEEIRTTRKMITYPVKGDVLNMFRWVVEAENGTIVAVAKLQNDPDGGKDVAQKLLLETIVKGKTPQQIQAHSYFKKLDLILRDCASGDLIRVYDITLIPDFMGAKYCLLRFDASNTCQEIRIVGVPASTSGSAMGR